ncbi:MAG: hypothetical protein ACXW34_09280, partial [Nitrospira sp.]
MVGGWLPFDILSAAIVLAVLVVTNGLAVAGSRRFLYSPHLFASGVALAVALIIIPEVVFGSAFAHMRLAPYALMI